jgi:hypothetical protein
MVILRLIDSAAASDAGAAARAVIVPAVWRNSRRFMPEL